MSALFIFTLLISCLKFIPFLTYITFKKVRYESFFSIQNTKVTNSHTTTYIWILNVYTIPTFEKKNFKDKKISTFLQKSVLFFHTIFTFKNIYFNYQKLHWYVYHIRKVSYVFEYIWRFNFQTFQHLKKKIQT